MIFRERCGTTRALHFLRCSNSLGDWLWHLCLLIVRLNKSFVRIKFGTVGIPTEVAHSNSRLGQLFQDAFNTPSLLGNNLLNDRTYIYITATTFQHIWIRCALIFDSLTYSQPLRTPCVYSSNRLQWTILPIPIPWSQLRNVGSQESNI